MIQSVIKALAAESHLHEANVLNALTLLFEENCTIPFVTRYRKEKTGSMDEVQLRTLRDRYTYMSELEASKERYLKVVEEHCKMKPELQAQLPALRLKFAKCQTKQELEDLYLPFKPKRRTRASIAKEKGLEPLFLKILAESSTLQDLKALALGFVTSPEAAAGMDKALVVTDVDAALAGAADIYAEQINENAELRSFIRQVSFTTGVLVSKKVTSATSPSPKNVEESKYENYFDYQEPIDKALSHRIMAVRRGEAEKVLKVMIDVDKESLLEGLISKLCEERRPTPAVEEWIRQAAEDAYKRLIAPSMETEIRLSLKNRAEDEAIRVFTTNLENLLLLPPIPGKAVCGIDPGIRTGSKISIVSETGKLLDHKVLYPHFDDESSQQTKQAKDSLKALISKHQVKCIAIGNGTGSREIDRLVLAVIRENDWKDVRRVVVNEAGASVYSTDEIAREEFPDLDPTIRSAVSIARRLQDPLAELVKIDPRSLGVGQYQHDCDVNKLNNHLKETVESCVNRVGVNVNTASYKLLSYVSGIGATLAKNIVSYRDQKGSFSSREDFGAITGFGPKTFEQAAGFLRVPGSKNPLDNSAVHPESYGVVERIAKDLNQALEDFIGKKELVNTVPFEKYVSEEIGMPTLLDIAKELVKPGRDLREDGIRLFYSDEVSTLDDLQVGMKLKGTVSNVTKFGAFVDIGVHQDGLVHISELSDKFIEDPASCVSVGDVLDVYVLDVDKTRKRISLSCKSQKPAAPKAASNQARRENSPSQARPQATQNSNSGQAQRPYRAHAGGGQQQNHNRGDRGPSSDRGQHRDGPSSSRPQSSRPQSSRPQQDQHPQRDRQNVASSRGHDAGRDQRQRGSFKKEPAKSFSLSDLVSKFNSRS
ncbi:MAG: helix-hairpin-helix domain-containing protein [Oligoflexales bacterium]|nr:helix-hairpin-helix domain-containing protein [Oligoflexales bacterium]